LAVEARVLDRECRLTRDRERGLGDVARDGSARMEGDDRQRREQLRGSSDRDQCCARALAQERREQGDGAAEGLGALWVQDERLAAPE
jgi:hypothetical protein